MTTTLGLRLLALASLVALLGAAGCGDSAPPEEHFDTLVECWDGHMADGFTAENALAHCHHDFADQWPADYASEDDCLNDPDHADIDAATAMDGSDGMDAVTAFCATCFATGDLACSDGGQ